MEPNIPPLDKMKKHYIKREMMSQQEKINDLIRMPFERELEEDDRMLDVIASWLKRDARKKNKNSEKNSSSKKKKTWS
jgi:cytochrome c553